MAAPQSAALKHWTRIVQRWPVDKVRPENVSFQTVMQRRIDKAGKPIAAAPIASPNDANAGPTATSEPFNETKEIQQANALYSLLDNRFSKAFPMPETLRHPATRPTHYDEVVKEMDEAPTRSWFDGLTKKIKGSLRFS